MTSRPVSKLNLLFLAVAWPALVIAADAASQPVIQVRGAVELEMEREITIGDIAEFKGFRDEEIGELKSIRLGDAPERGEMRTFTNVGLSQIFRTHMAQLQSERTDRITLLIPQKVTVTRKKFRLEAKDIEAEIQRQLKGLCAACEIEISQLSLPILGEAVPPSAKWQLKMRSEMPKGTFSVPLEIIAAESKRSYWVTGQVRVYRRIPVAKRSMEIGERFQANDFAIERKDVTYSTDAFPTETEIAAAVASRGIVAEQAIGRAMLRREQALRAGEIVKVVADSDAWQVSIDGVAQQSAHIGDTVRVKIPRTQKVLSGLLREKGVVEVQ